MPFKIKAIDFEKWAEGMASQSELPNLVKQLIEGSVDERFIEEIEFPSYDSFQTPGPDGRLDCKKKERYIPKGYSIWELSNQSGNLIRINGKIDTDFKTRTNNPINYEINKTTFIFVTGHSCDSKHKWKERIRKNQKKLKNKSKIWKKVDIYDSVNLEHWIEHVNYPTAIKIAKNILRILPQDIELLDSFGEMWCFNNGCIFSPDFILTDRQAEIKEITTWLTSPPSKLKIVADGYMEAIAFVWAVIKKMQIQEQYKYFNKTLIVRNENDFKDMINNAYHNIFIYTGRDSVVTNYASNRHHVLIPTQQNQNTDEILGRYIKLKNFGEISFIRALEVLGYKPEESRTLYTQCHGNLSKLKDIF